MKLTKIRKFWYFRVRNGVLRKGESRGGAFKWRFRRFWLDVETASGNWKARWTAAEHPYGYLIAGQDDENIEGFCQTMYEVGMLLTTDQGFVDDIQKALKKYSARLGKVAAKEAKKEDEVEERAALEFEKGVQEYVDTPKRYRKLKDREIEKKLKAARDLQEDGQV